MSTTATIPVPAAVADYIKYLTDEKRQKVRVVVTIDPHTYMAEVETVETVKGIGR